MIKFFKYFFSKPSSFDIVWSNFSSVLYPHTNPLKNEPVSRKALAYEPDKVNRPHHGFKRFALILLMPFFIITSYKVKADLSRGKIQPSDFFQNPLSKIRLCNFIQPFLSILSPDAFISGSEVASGMIENSAPLLFSMATIPDAFLSSVILYNHSRGFVKGQNPTVRKNRTTHLTKYLCTVTPSVFSVFYEQRFPLCPVLFIRRVSHCGV